MSIDRLHAIKSRAVRELVVIGVMTALAFAAAHLLDLDGERIGRFLEEHEDLQLDEVMVALVFSGIGFCVFAYRRWRELQTAYGSLIRTHEQLVLTEKMASLGRLTAGIAHEMNTPLGASRAALARIARLTGEYRSSIGDPEVRDQDHQAIATEIEESLRLAERGLGQAAGFVRSMKLRTRDTGAEPPRGFSAGTLVRDALLLVEHTVKASSCTLALDIPGGDVELRGVPSQLSQVVTNLVENAAHACSPDGGRIAVSLAREHNTLILAVRDDGPGIPADVLPRIFEPFFTTKHSGQGTGLGLSLVVDIVAKGFAGTVSATSAPGKGSTFTVRIPLSFPMEVLNGTAA